MEKKQQKAAGAIILSSSLKDLESQLACQVSHPDGHKTILLVQRGYGAPTFPGHWGLPAGIMDPSAIKSGVGDLRELTRQEAHEEVSMACTVGELLWEGVYETEKVHRSLSYYLCTEVAPENGSAQAIPETEGILECIGSGWFTFDQAMALPLAFKYGEVFQDLHDKELF